MSRYTVLLTSGTTGTVISETSPEEGMEITITLRDENGNVITENGIIEEVLEEEF